LCHSNPNRQISSFSKQEVKDKLKPTNGAIKAKQEGREFVFPEITRKALSDATLNRTAEWHKENGKKISKTIQEKVLTGEWHTSLAKHMHYEYNGVDLHGKWEVEYAKYLDRNGIKWARNKDSFAYTYDGKERRYTPDFYLPETDEYVEIKGYKTDKDETKWEQFPKHRKLLVLMKQELGSLGIKT